MNKQKIDEILKGIIYKHGLKSALIILEDDNSIGTGVKVGSSRFAEELPEVALEAVARVTAGAKKHEAHQKREILAELFDSIPADVRAEIFGDMPPGMKEAFDELMASRSDDKADKSDKARATVSDILDRMNKRDKH